MMQCKDIPTLPILEFIDAQDAWCNWFPIDLGGSDNLRTVRYAMPPDIPDKLIHAKMRQLIKNGLVDGCPCGCRGDFEITEKGVEFINQSKKEGVSHES